MEDGKEREARAVAKITKTSVEAIARPAPGTRAVLWDTEVKGFGVRVTSSGVRTYTLSYRMGGRRAAQRRITIGRHGSPWTAEQARKRAIELLALVRSEVDPAAQREQANLDAVALEERRASRMFNLLADRWFDRHVRGRLRSEKDVEGVVRRDLKPAFAGKTIDDISRADVAEALDQIGDRSNSAANKAHKWLRQMFNWFIDKGIVERSPLDRMSRPYAEESRKRVLGLLEIVIVWTAADELPAAFRDMYRMLILVGQRLREVSNLPWSELDLTTNAREWLLPAARSKNSRDHLVPLSNAAVAVVELRRDGRERPSGPVFTTDGKVSLAGFSKAKEALDEAVKEILSANHQVAALLGGRMEDWVVHDLRRTLATGCQAMRVRLEVTEAILNHASGQTGGIRGVYQLFDYYEEKAEALKAWSDLVLQAVGLWEAGKVAAIVALDPINRARRARGAEPASKPPS